MAEKKKRAKTKNEKNPYGDEIKGLTGDIGQGRSSKPAKAAKEAGKKSAQYLRAGGKLKLGRKKKK